VQFELQSIVKSVFSDIVSSCEYVLVMSERYRLLSKFYDYRAIMLSNLHLFVKSSHHISYDRALLTNEALYLTLPY